MKNRIRSTLIALKARDFRRAVDFYTRTLGFDLVSQYQEVWAEVAGPGIQLGISHQGGNGAESVPRNPNIVIVFEVEGIDKLYEDLRAKGVHFLGPVISEFHGKEALFEDTEGNLLMMHESARTAGDDGQQPSKRAAVTRKK